METNDELYPELKAYIRNYCWEFATHDERKAASHQYASSVLGHRTDLSDKLKEYRDNTISSNPEILKLLDNGYNDFIEKVVRRIYADHKHELNLNLCPKCKKIARTPRAQQCRFCFHEWRK